MGLANLVPGVSGGTMLVAAGIYPQFIDSVARVTTLRPDRRSVTFLLVTGGAAALVIVLLAGTVRDLVLQHRWAMYSLFLGSTLGGVPAMWRLIGRPDARSWLGAAAGIAAMAASALAPVGSGDGTGEAGALLLAGLGAFAAMILPGLSGGYLLVLSGQYVPILGAVDGLRAAVFAGVDGAWAALMASARVLAPFALGGVVAIVGVSSLVRLLLRRQRSLTLGFLLGLLAGAVLGLWPFDTSESGLALPGAARGVAALGLTACGFLGTSAVARLGASDSIQ